MAAFLHNLRHAWRMLGAKPTTSALAVAVLALGIGSTGTLFGVIDGIVLRPLPVPEGDRVLHVDCRNPQLNKKFLRVYLHDFLDWKAAQKSFSGFAAFTQETVSLSDDESFPERYDGSSVSPDILSVLRVEPFLGRGLTAEDAVVGAPAVALIGYRTWRNRFQGSSDVLGREVRWNGEPVTIVGVLPDGFEFPRDQQIWRPLQADVATIARGEGPRLRLVGRLRDGVSFEEAEAEMETLAARTAATYPEISAGRVPWVIAYAQRFVSPRFTRPFYLMFGAVWLVLLIACANVASLLMARAAGRARELALRTALGAGRLQMMGQLLAESLVLALTGATLGLGIAWLGTEGIGAYLATKPLPYWMTVGFDFRVVVMMAFAAILAALLAGIYPAWHASRADMASVLKDEARGGAGGRTFKRFHRILMIANVAFAWVLLVFTALLVRAAVRIHQIDFGLDTDRVFTARFDLTAAEYPTSAERVRFVERYVEALTRRPEVARAVATTNLPGEGYDTSHYGLEGRTYSSLEDYPVAFKAAVLSGFFEPFGVAAIDGRLIEDTDRQDTEPVVVVNRSFAELNWPGEEAVGKLLRLGRGDPGEPWRRVVGVAPDLPMGWVQDPNQVGFYVPYRQNAGAAVAIAVLTRDDPLSFADLARRELQALDPGLPIYLVQTLYRALEPGRAEARFFSSLFSGLGFVALLLSALGIYGVTALSVSQRTGEIGVRMALGAHRGRVVRLIVGEGLLSFGLGLAAGVVLAAPTTQYLRATLYDVDPFDAATVTTVAVFLGLVAVVGCLFPALEASRIEPAAALH